MQTMKMKAVMVSILSASGSANLPKLVTSPRERAMWPSNQSVAEATAKTIMATTRLHRISVPARVNEPAGHWAISKIMKIGIKKIRKTVSLFGKFIALNSSLLRINGHSSLIACCWKRQMMMEQMMPGCLGQRWMKLVSLIERWSWKLLAGWKLSFARWNLPGCCSSCWYWC
jgi:hypothetical protein